MAPLKRPLDARPFQLSRRRPRAHGRGCRYSGARHRRNRPSSLSRRLRRLSRCQASERCVMKTSVKRAAREAAGDACERWMFGKFRQLRARAGDVFKVSSLERLYASPAVCSKLEFEDAGPHS